MSTCLIGDGMCMRCLRLTVDLEIWPSNRYAGVKYFYKAMECSAGHITFACGHCDLLFDDGVDLYVHILCCCCGYFVYEDCFDTFCRIYETKTMERMLKELNKKIGGNVKASDVQLCISSNCINVLLPEFVYLRRNEEMFKRMDIGNICFEDCHISSGNHPRGIVCGRNMDYVIRSVINEMIRCSEGLEFQCSIPTGTHTICGMMYDCFPTQEMIKCHIKLAHGSPMQSKI